MKLSVALSAVCTVVAAAATYDGFIYTFSKSAQSPPQSVPTISLPNAALFLAQRLGLDEHFSLTNAKADESVLKLLNSAPESQKPLFAPQKNSKQRKSLYIIEGLTLEQAVQESNSLFTKAAQLSDNPTSRANRRLVEELITLTETGNGQNKGCRLGARDVRNTNVAFGATSGPEGYGACKVMGSGTSAQTEQKLVADDVKWLESGQWSNGDITDIFHLTQTQSQKESDYQVTVNNFLRSATEDHDRQITVVIVPNISKSVLGDRAWDTSGLRKREQDEEIISSASSSSSLSPATLKKPDTLSAAPLKGKWSSVNTTMGRCADSKAECEARTNKCSGHGSCKSTDKEKACFSCVCASTKESYGTVYWGGPACQKRDISVQFWLFSGFGIAATALVAWGIGLLYSMGEADLPSVLSAGVAPTTHK